MSLNANTFGQFLFGDLLPVNILSVTEDRYMPQIQQFVDRENAFLDQITSILADKGMEPQTGYGSGVGGRMQKLAQRGGVEATRGGQRWWVGFPIYAYGSKQTYEYAWLQRATFFDLASSILSAVVQDIETVITELLNGVLQNANFTFNDARWPGMKALTPGATSNINVYRMANNDGSVGSVYNQGREIQLATLNHYLVSGTANPTIAAFNSVRSALRNVGNDTDIVYVCSRATADYVASNFASTDYTQPVELLNTQLAQDLFGKYAIASSNSLLGPGIRTRGRVAYGELVEWPHFPDNYIMGYDRTKEPPLRMRVSDLASEQGLQLAKEDPDLPDVQSSPLSRKQWRRVFGVGARNRTNAVLMQITTNGAYTAPVL